MDGSISGQGAGGAGRWLLVLIAVLLAPAAWPLPLIPATAAAVALVDDAPAILSTYPPANATGVALAAAVDGSLAVAFSEPVGLAAGALELACERSGVHAPAPSGGPLAFTFVSTQPFRPGEACRATVLAGRVADEDADDPPDSPLADYTWAFRTAGEPVIINEVDAISAGGAGDFIELYDGGRGGTDLGGLAVVLYRGDEAAVYLAVGLDGYQTDGAGYFVLGAGGVAGADLRLADGTLRDGPDAVAVYAAPESDFPRNAPLTTANLVDAAVYGPGAGALLALLEPGQAALDEAARGDGLGHSNQRCPNGGGRPRETAAFIQAQPAPGLANRCQVDQPPRVLEVSPKSNATNVAVDAVVTATFSEAVRLAGGAVAIQCGASGDHGYKVEGGADSYRFVPLMPFVEGETCAVTIAAAGVSDADADDPPDQMASDVFWSFHTTRPVAEHVVINEVDADTPGVDAAEFIELYDGGAGHTTLDGLVVVLFNGADDGSYQAIDLGGKETNAGGYFLLGSAAVSGVGIVLPDGLLQNGPDAVALFAGAAAGFPDGTPVTTSMLMDAVVYGRAAPADAGLKVLLNAGQPQVDENGRGAGDTHSNQRCPNGEGGGRNTAGFKQNTPTPGSANDCVTDAAPAIASILPAKGATGVGIHTTILVEFDEPVSVTSKWANINCTKSGIHTYRSSGGPELFTIAPDDPFSYLESCTVTIYADRVADQDADDPPDFMAQKFVWTFKTAGAPADFMLINEIDPDTPGSDTAEFLELFDGGVGQTALDGLVLVLFNGSTGLSYLTIDLNGWKTDASGYFVAGNAAVKPGLVLPDGTLQNGPDAVGLYAADVTQFPNGSPAGVAGLVDAIVYGDADAVPPGFLVLLEAGEQPANEDGRGAADQHSLQRCPNGAGGQRRTAAFAPNNPSPGTTSQCVVDKSPGIIEISPPNGATAQSIYTDVSFTFDEPVVLSKGAIEFSCTTGGQIDWELSGGPVDYIFKPVHPLAFEDECRLKIPAAAVADVDADDPPDHMAADFEAAFTTIPAPPDFLLINEIDADTPGTDKMEFIELYDGGRGNTDLTGLVVVLYNGQDDRSYHAIDLAGARTDPAGYLVIGNKDVPGKSIELPVGKLQNGADAVAIYSGALVDFPNGTALHESGLLDAIVYGTDDQPDKGLLVLLHGGELQVDEAGGGKADVHSSGRCPDGAGGQRRTAAYRQDLPTPGASNTCAVDAAPVVMEVYPADGSSGLPAGVELSVTFSEEVLIGEGWLAIECASSGARTATVSGGPARYVITPHAPFEPGELCAVTLSASAVTDSDADDPPDHPAADYRWQFTIAPPVASILINEIDADTPGSDTAEFIELYDGGRGHVSLSGLVVVLWNGKADTAYQAIDLTGLKTDENGYFVLGGAGVTPDVTLGPNALQNGPDAVAIHAGIASDFPSGAALTLAGLIDAVVYGPGGDPDSGLLTLLAAGQPQVDEGDDGNAEAHALQRCPDGAGGPRWTEGFRPSAPTPGVANVCPPGDDPPRVLTVMPADGAADVAIAAAIVVEFSEDVTVEADWYEIACTGSEVHPATVTGGPRSYTLAPDTAFHPGETCTFRVIAAAVHDSDPADPPDSLAADLISTFTIAPPIVRPLAGFTSNSPIWIGETALFTNTSSGPGPLSAIWDFGDGQGTSAALHPTHTYHKVGTYVVTLTVTGPTGTASHSAEIEVRPRRVMMAIAIR